MAEGNGNGAALLPAPARQLTNDEALFELDQRKAKMFAASPLVPAHLKGANTTEAVANCYIALTMARELRQDPLVVMQNIYIVHGKAGFAASYLIAKANNSGKFSDPIDWEVKGSGANMEVTAFATVAKTGRKVSFTVTMKTAAAEGWTKNPKYATLGELMLRYRSATLLARLYCPEVMLGMKAEDELDEPRPAQGVVHTNRVASLESKLGIGAPAAETTEVVDDEGEILNVTKEEFDLGN